MRILLAVVSAVTLAAIGCSAPTYSEEELSSTSNAIKEPEAAAACTAESTCATIKESSSPSSCSLLVVFDGSGVYSPDTNSNVGKMFKEARGASATSGDEGLNGEVVDASTTRVYIEGVPSLPFGASAERVDRGRSAICQHLAVRAADACDIVLIGYSRGAFIANQLAHALNDEGCADGSHKGQRIAFLGAFDPVNNQMGSEWENNAGDDQSWAGSVPSNVETVLQVYKDPKKDPRGGIEGASLTTTLMGTGAAASSCNAAMTSKNHPDGKAWHHGQLGHGTLPLETMKCALDRSDIHLF